MNDPPRYELGELAFTNIMWYAVAMSSTIEQRPFIMPVDDEHAAMMTYARSPEGRAKIERAQAEIDEGLGILAGDAYFEKLKERRGQRRATR